MFYSAIVALLYIITCTASAQLQIRAECNDEHPLCAPDGTLPTKPPPVGHELAALLQDMVAAVRRGPKAKRGLEQVAGSLQGRAADGLCCGTRTQCFLLDKYHIPFCYDQFTTDFTLRGNATGNLISGEYNSANGDKASLQSGNYTLADGSSGNIYDAITPSSNPSTATPSLPAHVTASDPSGIQSRTSSVVYTVITKTIPGTTIPISIIPATTVAPIIENQEEVVPGYTSEAFTIPGVTIPPRATPVTVFNPPVPHTGCHWWRAGCEWDHLVSRFQ